MKQAIIVGGGPSGLLVGHFLKKQGADFIGLEKSAHLGGRLDVGHHRLYDEHSVALLTSEFDLNEWDQMHEPPQERHKGQWRLLDKELTQPSEFYLRNTTYYVPKESFDSFTKRLADSIGRNFRTLHGVAKIFPEEKKILCENGDELNYDRLYWCADINKLHKVWQGEKASLSKILKAEVHTFCGINLDIELENDSAYNPSSLLFTFRFKDKKLSTIGNFERSNEGTRVSWILFLPKKLFEDRDEVAKCVRAMKREIYKEFPEIRDTVKNECIAYLPSISGEKPAKSDTLEVLPNVTYIGPQIRLLDSDESLLNLDLALNNLIHSFTAPTTEKAEPLKP